MKHSLKQLEEYKTICVTGNAGSGKTRFCLELMSQFQKKHPDLIALILTDSNEWRKLEFNQKTIIFIDDVIGRSNLDNDAFNSWRRVFDLMSCRLGSVYIIFALRNCIWQLKKHDLIEYSLFSLNDPVDLSGSEFAMTSEEKLKMLKTFCIKYGVKIDYPLPLEKVSRSTDSDVKRISFETLNTIANMELRKGFPYQCVMFFSRANYIREESIFFYKQCFYHEKEQVDDILRREKYLHYAVLIFFFLKGQCFTRDEILQSQPEISIIAGMIGDVNPKKIINLKIKDCISDMQDTLLSVSDNILKLRHMVTFEAVLMSFGENFPEEFLNSINKTVLFAYVRSNGYVAEKQEVILRLSEKMTGSLAKKLIHVYGSQIEQAYTEVYKHPAFHDEKLVTAFLEIVAADDRFRLFINSFVAGACENKKDILASETIKRFLNLKFYRFDAEVFQIVVSNDLICTCEVYINNEQFRNFLFEFLESKGFCRVWEFFLKACQSGSLQCVKALMKISDQENDLETDGDPVTQKQGFSLKDHIDLMLNWALDHHRPSPENDWNEVLVRLDETLCSTYTEKQEFYKVVFFQSFYMCKLDITLKYLEKIYPVAVIPIKKTMIDIFVKGNLDKVFYALCSKMRRENFQLRSKTAAEICIFCVSRKKNESMFLTLLTQNKCDFNTCDGDSNTILHVCEQSGFSNSVLLELLKRPEGPFMFLSENAHGRTPVQCRESYEKIKKLWVKRTCVKWSDDNFIHWY